MKVLLLGGAGSMAKACAEDLLNIDFGIGNCRELEVILADKDSEKLNARAKFFDNPKISSAVIDVNDYDALVKLMKESDVIINFSISPFTIRVVRAALEAEVNIITSVSPSIAKNAFDAPEGEMGLVKEEFLNELHDEFKKKNLTAILGVGAAPGVTNIAARYVIDQLDTVDTVIISYGDLSFDETDSPFGFSPIGMIRIYNMKPVVLEDGKLKQLPRLSGRQFVQFPKPIELQEGFYITHEEPITLPRTFRDKGLQNSLCIACWGSGNIEKFEFLDSLGMLDLNPRKVGDVSVIPSEVLVSVCDYGKEEDNRDFIPNDYSAMKVIVSGEKDGRWLEYDVDVMAKPYNYISSGVNLTGIPSAIVARMLLNGDITEKGAFPPEVGIDPTMFFKEIKKRNIHLTYSVRHEI